MLSFSSSLRQLEAIGCDDAGRLSIKFADSPDGPYAARTLDEAEKVMFIWCLQRICEDTLRWTPEIVNADLSAASRHALHEYCPMLASASPPLGASDKEQEVAQTPNRADILSHLEKCGIDVNVPPAQLQSSIDQRIAELQGSILREFLEWEKYSAENPSKDAVGVVIDQLSELEAKFDAIEAWMSESSEQLVVMKGGIAQIEAENNALREQEAEEARIISTLGDLVSRFTLEEEVERILDKPFECLAHLRQAVELGVEDSSAMLQLSRAASSIRTMIAQADSREELRELHSIDAVKERVDWLQSKQDAFCWHIDFFMEDRIKSLARAGGSIADVHGSLMGYAPLIAEVRMMTPDALAQIQNAYVEEMKSCYATIIESLFERIKSRVGGGVDLPSALADLADAQLGAHAEEMRRAKSKVEAAVKGDAFTCANGMRAALSELVPLIAAEQRALDALFLGMGANERDGVLERIFDMYSIVHHLEDFISGIRSNNLEMILMVVDVETIISSNNDCNVFVTAMTNPAHGLQIKLQLAINAFVEEQVQWISHFRENTRYCGVLDPVKKFPTFVDIVVSVESMVGDNGQIISIALQKMSMALLSWLHSISTQRPKYVDICRIENLSFLISTVSPRHVPALQKFIANAKGALERSEESYVVWILKRPFGKVMEFARNARALERTTNAADISYHLNESQFRGAMDEMEGASGSCAALLSRIAKHFGKNDMLLDIVTARAFDAIVKLRDELSIMAREAYRTTLHVTRDDIENAFVVYKNKK